MLQETIAGYEVRCCASQRLHEARRGVHFCVQAAAAARVAGGRDIVELAYNGDGASVLCHVIADATSVNEREYTPHEFTPLHRSAQEGRLEVARLLLQCNADIEAKDDR